jgi:hypothetical protein
VNSHFGSWSPGGLPNLQRTIAKVKTHWIEKFLIIEKLLECICLKWIFMTHLDIWNTSYGQKKGWESNWQFDSRPLKVKNHSLARKWHATYHWKPLDKDYNFASNIVLIKGLHTKLCAPKVAGVSTFGISRLSLGSPGTKCQLGAGPMARHIVYYKGEGDGFP